MEVGHFNVHILITSEILSKMLYFCRNAFKFVTCEYQMTHTLAKMKKTNGRKRSLKIPKKGNQNS